MESNKMREIMYRIKSQRLDMHLTYQDVSNLTNIPKSTLQRYETGFIRNMPLDKIGLIAEALQTTPSYLMGWADDTPTPKEVNLLTNFSKLNRVGEDEALKRVEELTQIERYKKESKIMPIGQAKKEPVEEEYEIITEAAHHEGEWTEADYTDIANIETIVKARQKQKVKQ